MPPKEDNAESKPLKSSGNQGLEVSADSVDLDDKIWADVDKGLDELLREVRFLSSLINLG